MRFQHQIHIVVQENDFNQRLHAWEYFILHYFATNKSNYARYILYPGLKSILEANCISVQAEDRYSVRTAIDQRGEETFNHDAKTTRCIKTFASDSSSIVKWTLNRAEQATDSDALYKMCSINESSEMYIPSRPSQILKLENCVADIARILTEEYLNLFDVGLDKSVLHNLSSGVPLPGKIADEILSFPDKGITLAEEFLNKRLLSDEITLSDPIRRNIDKKTLLAKKTVQIHHANKVKSIEVNRNILWKVVAYSTNFGKPIDYAESLKFPLSPIPLSTCHPDGVKRSCNKAELIPFILPEKL